MAGNSRLSALPSPSASLNARMRTHTEGAKEKPSARINWKKAAPDASCPQCQQQGASPHTAAARIHLRALTPLTTSKGCVVTHREWCGHWGLSLAWEQVQHPSIVSPSSYKNQDTEFSTSCGNQIIQYFLIPIRGGYAALERKAPGCMSARIRLKTFGPEALSFLARSSKPRRQKQLCSQGCTLGTAYFRLAQAQEIPQYLP